MQKMKNRKKVFTSLPKDIAQQVNKKYDGYGLAQFRGV